jgi:uncharacterized glyoxalase superfamily protein PhnB
MSNLYPCLYYDDAPAAIEFLCRAFGFRRRLVVPGENGAVLHSELSFEGPDGALDVIMVGTADGSRHCISAQRLPGVHQSLCVRVADPDAHHARAVAAGAVVQQPLRDEDYGSRGYMARDPEGQLWYFATYTPGTHWTE